MLQKPSFGTKKILPPDTPPPERVAVFFFLIFYQDMFLLHAFLALLIVGFSRSVDVLAPFAHLLRILSLMLSNANARSNFFMPQLHISVALGGVPNLNVRYLTHLVFNGAEHFARKEQYEE